VIFKLERDKEKERRKVRKEGGRRYVFHRRQTNVPATSISVSFGFNMDG
jgi:hypothetical protein